ncbi:aspartyl/asparaginyl beta-hydroxylase domain-containing protein [Pacificimonas sp. WHA3]|uniref:Aspartyl/asparaginyl beta-hydroxylase domain-containing protein n=1 Tax=Pacificimonas pallii TaxID=2827236 RepID=A0ABS6SDA2_9SPHN|nr:aspartyl/asparaginyl beta-hydroxylase domain-containing protein [Pacificimonas pallii]MBV7256394.1 aspartyl/asparaginyl beta-hydroxylase domain-containing protein [Pacificimonas pallii]
MAGFARFILEKYLYPVRHGVNAYVGRHSLIPDKAIFGADEFEWAGPSQANWRAIRDEFRAQSGTDDSFRPIGQLSPDHVGLDQQEKWHSAVLHGYGVRIDANCARYPKTAALVERIPGMISAMFSVHQPGAHLPEHSGVTKGMLTCHLSLDVPPGDCAIRVEDHTHAWREGEWFVFDDTRRHEAWNRTAEPRLNLLVHVERPLSGGGKVVQWIFDRVVRNSPFVRDFHQGIVKHARAPSTKRDAPDRS